MTPATPLIGAAQRASTGAPVPAWGADAGGVALADGADVTRATSVPAGTRGGAAPAGGGPQPAAELLRLSRIRRGGKSPDVRGEDVTPVGRWWVPLKGCRRWAFGAVPLGAEAMETRLRAQLA